MPMPPSVDFIQAYVFPGGLLISEREFARLAHERGLTWQDRQDFGLDYARTLKLWREALASTNASSGSGGSI